MSTLRNKQTLAAFNKDNCGEQPRSNLAQNTNVPRSQDDYITQISEEIEGTVTKTLSKEFSWTKSPILGALSQLDEFLLNTLIPGHSRTQDPLRRRPGSHLAQTREQLRTTPRVILIMRRASLRVRLQEALVQMMVMTNVNILVSKYENCLHLFDRKNGSLLEINVVVSDD